MLARQCSLGGRDFSRHVELASELKRSILMDKVMGCSTMRRMKAERTLDTISKDVVSIAIKNFHIYNFLIKKCVCTQSSYQPKPEQ